MGELVYVDRPPRPLTSTERGDLPSDGGAPSGKLLPKTEGPFWVRSATEITEVVDQDGVSNCVSIERVTKMPRGTRDGTVAAPTTDSPAGIPKPSAEYVVDHLVDHRGARSGTQYKVRWYGYTPADCSAMRLSGRDRGPMVQQQKQQRENLPMAQRYGASDSPFSV